MAAVEVGLTEIEEHEGRVGATDEALGIGGVAIAERLYVVVAAEGEFALQECGLGRRAFRLAAHAGGERFGEGGHGFSAAETGEKGFYHKLDEVGFWARYSAPKRQRRQSRRSQ